jgi:hypothetical protein
MEVMRAAEVSPRRLCAGPELQMMAEEMGRCGAAFRREVGPKAHNRSGVVVLAVETNVAEEGV